MVCQNLFGQYWVIDSVNTYHWKINHFFDIGSKIDKASRRDIPGGGD
jgi:hypothetical protein